MNNIHFFEEDINSRLAQKKLLKVFLNQIIQSEKKLLNSLSFIFCSDEYLLKINKTFLNHNYYTDVISFLISSGNEPIIAEIYISCERVRENSKNLKVLYPQELIRVIIHGTLHICGYSDKTSNLKQEMDRIQEVYLNTWIVSRGTIKTKPQ